MTRQSDKTLRDRLNTPAVAERDTAFTVSLLGKVRRVRRRGLLVNFLWIAAIAGFVGLLGAGFYLGAAEAIQRAIGAIATG